MQARKRLAVAEATRTTRIYRLHVAATRGTRRGGGGGTSSRAAAVKLEYLPCTINASTPVGSGGGAASRAHIPIPDPEGQWIDVCSTKDPHCFGCRPNPPVAPDAKHDAVPPLSNGEYERRAAVTVQSASQQ